MARPVEMVGIFQGVEEAASCAERLQSAGIPQDNLETLSVYPLPAGTIVAGKGKTWFKQLTLMGAAAGAFTGFSLAAGTAWLYPVYTGDKPIISFFPVGIITYELMMLFAIVGTVVGMFLEMRLPDYLEPVPVPEVSEGFIGISVVCRSEDEGKTVRQLFSQAGALRVRAGKPRKEQGET